MCGRSAPVGLQFFHTLSTFMNTISKIFFSFVLFCSTFGVVAQAQELVILHTNDTHSQIEPNATTAKYDANMGGVVRRDAIIRSIRAKHENVILIDAGDFVQGTPYFNAFNGDVEIEMMNRMGYQVAVLGNHEFDNGIDPLVHILKQADFPFIIANYDCSATALAPYVKPTTIIEQAGIKIGFIGIGSQPEGLIAAKNMVGIVVLDPVVEINKHAALLREAGCDYVVVVSHMGYERDDDTRGDRMLAAQSHGVDLIIGGHSHTLLKQCVEVTNKDGKPVRITQAGGRGAYLGRIDLKFE